MAGHSKWWKVKHFKGKIDGARARIFSRYSKEIAVAARAGGGDPNFNPRLRRAIDSAKAGNMPNENIERAIKKGTGELESVHYEEVVYEGYGPGGVAILVEVLTDNKNRAAAEIRRVFTKHAGSLASPGSVGYLFQRRGQIIIPHEQISEDDLTNLILEAGADDLRRDEDSYEVVTSLEAFDKVLLALKARQLNLRSAKLTYLPQSYTMVTDESVARKVLELVEALDENDDVQEVYSNFDVPEKVLTETIP